MPLTTSKSKTTQSYQSFLRLLILGFFITGTLSLSARNFYISSSSGNDGYTSSQAQNQYTPWRSLSKLNSFFSSLTGGDVVYFKAGDVFYGSIIANQSGSNGNPILLTSYGSGNKPLISGFTTVNNWTNIGNNIYQANVPGVSSALNLVSINGRPQQIGRYPNASNTGDPYLYYESSGGNTITDNQGLSTNWTGASVIIRNRRWIMNKFTITGQSGGKLWYNDPNNIPASAGFGYFIVNDPRTLDQFGEWYLNTSNKNLQVHFGGNNPSNFSVKVSTIDKTIDLGTSSYITVQNLSFEGANITGLLANWSNNISILQCNFNQMGGNGITINGISNTLIDGVNVSNILNNGMTIENSGNTNTVLRNSTVHNVGMLAGMGENGDGGLMGIVLKVQSNALMEYNNIDSIGYSAIDFQGNDFTIRNNFINNYCFRKDDGGAIYTYGNGVAYTNRQIYNNIILNAIGAGFGTAGKTPEAEGIYMDRGTEGVNIHDNSVAHMGRTGLLLNSIQNVQANNNTVYDGRWSIEICRFAGDQTTRNNQITNNIFYPRTSDQQTMAYKNFSLNVPTSMSIQQDIAAAGTIDYNMYGAINSTPFSYYYSYYAGGQLIWPASSSLNSWKSFSNKDWNSKNPIKVPTSVNDVRFEYNATQSAKTISLDANYVGVDNTNYNGSITLQPYTSKIIIKNGPSIPTTAPATTLYSSASVPGINCTGSNTTVTVNGSGGSAPYLGTGNFSTNAGKGSLRLDFPSYITNKTSIIFANVGSITAGKNYMLNFSALASYSNRSLKVYLRQSGGNLTPLTEPYMDQFINNTRTDYKLLFTPTISDINGRIDIEIPQSSGTTYVDNIAFFESDLSGNLISSNAFPNGIFESNITGVNIWSSNNNQVASWDNTGKISNINYYTVTDSKGVKSTTGINIKQPATTLSASVTNNGTTLIVNGSGGAYPYTGTGNYPSSIGYKTFTITDANGCSATTSINVTSTAGAKTSSSATTLSDGALSTETFNTTTLQISSYPNPTITNFSLLVQGGSAEKIAITVMGADSRTVYQTTGSTNNTYKFGDNFAPGLYIIRVMQGVTVQTLKVIKGN